MSFNSQKLTPIGAFTVNMIIIYQEHRRWKRGRSWSISTQLYCLILRLFVDQRCSDTCWNWLPLYIINTETLFNSCARGLPQLTCTQDGEMSEGSERNASVHIMESERFTACPSTCPSHSQDEAHKTVTERLSFMEAWIIYDWVWGPWTPLFTK